MTKEENIKKANEKGITLVALVVTIVILLILAGITINYVFSEGGLFDTAKNSGNTWGIAENSDINAIKELNGMVGNLANSEGSGTTTPLEPDEPTPPEEPKPLVTDTSLKEIDTKTNREVLDEYGNKVVIPKGFKIAEDSGSTVPEGIVIEDGYSTPAEGTEGTSGYKPPTTGNQFVWIPVGTVKMAEGKTADVQLGRYTFNCVWNSSKYEYDGDGTPNLEQAAFNTDGTPNYINEDATVGAVLRGSYDCYELSISREGIASSGRNGLNATAKELGVFLESAENNGGYYIARYEASYGSGYIASGADDIAKYGNAKPLSKVSIAHADIMSYSEGKLWNNITQLNASKVARNMYNNEETVGVESDLMNSYAWDTAIVYIRQMKEEYSNFAGFKYNTAYGSGKNVGSTSKNNTGVNSGDKFCNIYDMVANCYEWTTEYSTYINSYDNTLNTCVNRGGAVQQPNSIISGMSINYATTSSNDYGFRPICYIKENE